ncbi:MAG: CDP-glucose 4,6-dehydratase [Magnetovibrionaceae bacterium]
MLDPLVRDVFKGRRVLVTGHTGFKGSWLTLWLLSLGAEVAGYALAPEEERNHFDLLGVSNRIRHEIGDVRDGERLNRFFEEVQPEIVLHLAAQALVRRSYNDPKETFDVNVGGATNLLEAVRKTPSVKSLVFVTSDKCYWNEEWVWGYRETDTLGGKDPYSASKAAAEIVLTAYQESYFRHREGFRSASARAGNVIGGGDWSADRIIPDCVRALDSGETIDIRSPSATRPWQHVLEPLSGYLLLAARQFSDGPLSAGAWNFGPAEGQTRSVKAIVEGVIDRWGSGTAKFGDDNTGLMHEARLLALNIDKARLDLGWRPTWDVDTCLDMVVCWYKAVSEGAPASDISLAQIKAFEEHGS